MVFVNYYANAAPALVFKAANHAAMAIDLYIAPGTYDLSGKQNREVHHRTHGDVAIHREQHAIGGDILRLRGTRPARRIYLHGQMQRKPRSTLHRGIVLNRSLL